MYRDGSPPCRCSRPARPRRNRKRTGEKAETTGEIEQELADAREECHRLRGQLEKYEQRDRERDLLAGAGRHKRKRPALLKGRTVKMDCPLGDLYVTINEDETGRPFEVFCTLGKAGGAAMADAEAIGRLISLALRSGIPITAVRDQLRGISCDRAVGFGLRKVLSAPDAIGQAIEYYLQEKDGIQEGTHPRRPRDLCRGRGRSEPCAIGRRFLRAGLSGQLPGLRHRPALFRGRVREVPCVRLQRVQLSRFPRRPA